jgi:Na+-transporting methylmalonyl-CoA/oxaloacetate decarboxylase gamma subunit
MDLSMTLHSMLQQGDIINLICMGVIFSLIVFILTKLDRFDKVADNARPNSQPALAAVHNAGDQSEITAAISAAVNEYRKNK